MAGISDSENKKVAKAWINGLKPKTVLDIGAGQGTYSTLAKNKAQYWTALEVFYPYVKMYDLEKLYDRIIIGDARYIDYYKLRSVGVFYDLAIIADMLEHMTKDEAKELITEVLVHCRNLLICFPVEHQEQHAGDEGNDFETHVDHWDYDEMVEFLANRQIVNSIKGDVLAYFLVKGVM